MTRILKSSPTYTRIVAATTSKTIEIAVAPKDLAVSEAVEL